MGQTIRRSIQGVLALAIAWLSGVDNLTAQNPAAAKAAIVDLAAGKSNPKAIAKQNQPEDVMRVFKLRAKGGHGVGPQAGAFVPDGIEAMVIKLSKKELTKGELAKEAAALIDAAEISVAVGRVNAYYTPQVAKPGKNPKDWEQFNDGLIKSSRELIDALKAADPAKVKTAAAQINHNCNGCHAKFRDD